MPVYKENQTWYVKCYYKDWQGVNRPHTKRWFKRKADAQNYEREFKLKKTHSTDMKFDEFIEIYERDCLARLAIAERVEHESIDVTYRYAQYFQPKEQKLQTN